MLFSNFTFRVAEDQTNFEHILESIYRLRYQVYVNEWGFENPEDHPSGLEKDDYDLISRHIYAHSVANDNVIGTARLIMPSEFLLPLQQNFDCDESLFNNPNHRIAEISRLAISKDYRRRAIDHVIFNLGSCYTVELEKHRENMQNIEEERRKFEHELVRGIYLMIYRESIRLQLTHWCAVMARGLSIILSRWGISFEKVGPEKEYHGIRAPYLLSLQELEKNLAQKNPELLQQAQMDFV